MNPLLKMMMARLHRPAGEDGADTGGTDTATEDRGDQVDPSLTAENLEALVGANDDGDDGAGEEVDAGGAAEEGDAAAADAGDQAGKPAPGTIPKGRFNEVNQQRKDAQAALALANKELERYRAQEAAAAKAPAAPAQAAATPAPAAAAAAGAPDLDAQEEAYEQALIDGDTKKAAQIRREMNESMRAQVKAEAKAEAVQELTQRQTAQLLETTAKNVTDAFPYLNTAEGAEALDLILAARDRKMAKGMPAHLALLEAANAIAPKFAPDDETPSRDSASAAPAKDLRPAAALARGAADSTAQPPALQAGIGQRATAARVNVSQLTEEQFEALTPAEKKRLRGD